MKFNNLNQLEKEIEYKFNNINLLQTALTHRSSLNEKDIEESYERLEYLGDAILEMLISIYLFNTLPQKDEGYLTAARSIIVRTESLAKLAQTIKLPDYLHMSKGEIAGGGRNNPSILEDSVESLIGALFLDGNLKAAQEFFDKYIVPHALETLKTNQLKDPKSKLQEKVQSKGFNSPSYKTVKEIGPDHQKTFTVAVYVNKQKISQGTGKNKQLAEQEAAKKALKLV